MKSFQIQVFHPSVRVAFYDVTKDNRSGDGPIYCCKDEGEFTTAFRLTKMVNGWRQLAPKNQEYPQAFIDKAGAEIEKEEAKNVDGDDDVFFEEYDEEAELRMMGLDDEETEEGFDWVEDD